MKLDTVLAGLSSRSWKRLPIRLEPWLTFLAECSEAMPWMERTMSLQTRREVMTQASTWDAYYEKGEIVLDKTGAYEENDPAGKCPKPEGIIQPAEPARQ